MSRVHPVFHVSLLKQSHDQTTATEFPSEWISDFTKDIPVPERVLQHRQIDPQNNQMLIWWKHQDPSEVTWEDSREFKLQFPDFITELEDKFDF